MHCSHEQYSFFIFGKRGFMKEKRKEGKEKTNEMENN